MDKKAKILLIVEGEKTDVRLMSHLLDVYGIGQSHQIVSYNTNIYELYNRIKVYESPDEVDMLRLMKSKERDEEKKKIFDDNYSDILLIFDLDPQDPQYSADKIKEMAEIFHESSEMGKLYINYPMVESFYHMKSIPDENYNSYTVKLDQLRNHEYKAYVNSISHNPIKFASTKEECSIVINQNIGKACIITNKKQQENQYPDFIDILSKQVSLIDREQELYVLCTCCFYIVDYNPKLII